MFPISFESWVPFKTIFHPSLINPLYHPQSLHSQQMSSPLLQRTETIKEKAPQVPCLPTCQHDLHLPSGFSSFLLSRDHTLFSPNTILQSLYRIMSLPTSSEALCYQLLLFPLSFAHLWLLPFSLSLFQSKTRTFSGPHHSGSHLASCSSSTDRLTKREYLPLHLLFCSSPHWHPNFHTSQEDSYEAEDS